MVFGRPSGHEPDAWRFTWDPNYCERLKQIIFDEILSETMVPKTNYYILAILVLGFADGAIAYALFPGQVFAPTSLALSIVALFLVFVWYRLDSDSRAYRRSPLLSVAVVGVTIFALPYYLFRTRGLRQGALATLVMIVVTVGYSAMGYLGQLVARAVRI